jgi:hypothetical protein
MDDIVVKGLLLTNSDEPNINTSLTLIVYPNPASENVTIMVNNSISSEGNIEILSVDGKVLYREVFGSVKNSQIEIVLRNYSPGLYFVKAVSADNINIQKLIIK